MASGYQDDYIVANCGQAVLKKREQLFICIFLPKSAKHALEKLHAKFRQRQATSSIFFKCETNRFMMTLKCDGTYYRSMYVFH